MLAPYWHLSVLLIVAVSGAPVPQHSDASESGKSDVPVEQLEKLKLADTSKETLDLQREHVEFHALDSVKEDGEVVSKFEEHASADSAPGEKPQLHAHAQLDIPAAGVHKEVVQDGTHVSVVDATVPTTVASEEQTAKVFHGAARLVQPGSATSANNPANHAASHPPNHSAVRRAFNVDITKENKNKEMEHFSYPGVQYKPLDMAEYVFWTGDERGVTTAIEDFLQEGMMTKEEAINFLQEIKFNIEYLRAHYAQNVRVAEEGAQQERLRNILMEQNAKEYQYRTAQLPYTSDRSASKSWELNNMLPALPATDLRPEPMKRSYDPMLQTNIISTSDYERDGQIITEEEYEEMMEKLRAADSLYTEYTLEEIIYQLAKMMFSQSLSREPASARAATQRFMAFLELEAERGQLSRSIEKKVLDVMIAALTDTIGDHPELLQHRDSLGLSPANKVFHQFLDYGTSEPGMSRALLAAYKDELLKGPHKLPFPERN